jgi:hypothetical protein
VPITTVINFCKSFINVLATTMMRQQHLLALTTVTREITLNSHAIIRLLLTGVACRAVTENNIFGGLKTVRAISSTNSCKNNFSLNYVDRNDSRLRILLWIFVPVASLQLY